MAKKRSAPAQKNGPCRGKQGPKWGLGAGCVGGSLGMRKQAKAFTLFAPVQVLGREAGEPQFLFLCHRAVGEGRWGHWGKWPPWMRVSGLRFHFSDKSSLSKARPVPKPRSGDE